MVFTNLRTIHMICFRNTSNYIESMVPMPEQSINDTTSS